MLSKQSIEKYQAIYSKQFGVNISLDDAAEQALRLLNLARVVLQPMPKAWERRYNDLLSEKRRRREKRPEPAVAILRGDAIMNKKGHENRE